MASRGMSCIPTLATTLCLPRCASKIYTQSLWFLNLPAVIFPWLARRTYQGVLTNRAGARTMPARRWFVRMV